jgi:hypothetical protein
MFNPVRAMRKAYTSNLTRDQLELIEPLLPRLSLVVALERYASGRC